MLPLCYRHTCPWSPEKVSPAPRTPCGKRCQALAFRAGVGLAGLAFKGFDHVAGEDTTVSGMAGRYATALFELALDGKSVDAVKADLESFERLVGDLEIDDSATLVPLDQPGPLADAIREFLIPAASAR